MIANTLPPHRKAEATGYWTAKIHIFADIEEVFLKKIRWLDDCPWPPAPPRGDAAQCRVRNHHRGQQVIATRAANFSEKNRKTGQNRRILAR